MEIQVEEREEAEAAVIPALDRVVGARLAPLLVHRHLVAVLLMAANRQADGTARRRRPADDDRRVALFHPPIREGLSEDVVGRVGFRHHHQAGRVLVEAVHDAGPLHPPY